MVFDRFAPSFERYKNNILFSYGRFIVGNTYIMFIASYMEHFLQTLVERERMVTLRESGLFYRLGKEWIHTRGR